jgi:hypothetical protein
MASVIVEGPEENLGHDAHSFYTERRSRNANRYSTTFSEVACKRLLVI